MNKKLSECSEIVKDPWFKKQISKNIIIGLIGTFPLFLGIFRGYSLMTSDKFLSSRFSRISEKDTIPEKASKYYYSFFKHDEDSKKVVAEKENLKAKILAILIVVGFGYSINFFFSMVFKKIHYIPKNTDNFLKLSKNNGMKLNYALVTPLGVLLDITGYKATDLVHMDVLWSGINIKVREYEESPTKRSMVFFKKSYELKNSYIYDLKSFKKLKLNKSV